MPGPNPNFASCWSQLGTVVNVANAIELFGNANTPNYLDLEDALTVALDGEFTPNALPILRQAVRQPLAGTIAAPTLRRLFYPFLQEMSRVIGAPELKAGGQISEADALKRIRQYMEDNSQSLNSRGMTIDTSAAGSVTGTGAIHRLTVDKDNNVLECIGAESKVFYCDKDQTSGARKHAEEFEFRFADAEQDALYWTGTGGTKRVTSLNCRSGNLLVNPSFEQGATADNTALSSLTQLTGWTVAGTASNVKTHSNATRVYRGYPGEPSTLYGIEFVADDTIAQVLRVANPGAQFDPRVPYFCQVAWHKRSSATGNLNLHVGSQTVTVDISTGTNDTFAPLVLTIGTKNWYDTFKEGDLDIKIVVDTLATGTVVVDDVVLAPMTNLDGTWWAVVGGATPWIRGDTLSFTGDADGGTRAKLSYWLWRAYGNDTALLTEMRGWFPTDNGGSETIADPS